MHIEIINETPEPRSYDFSKGDIRVTKFKRAMRKAIERSESRGRQTVRLTEIGAGQTAWLIQDADEATVATESIKIPQVTTDYNHHGTGPRPQINVLVEEPRPGRLADEAIIAARRADVRRRTGYRG